MRCVTFFADEIGFFKNLKEHSPQLINFNIARREANTAKRNAIKRYEQKLVNKLSQDHILEIVQKYSEL